MRLLPAATPLHPALEAAILAPPSALDKPGALYVFDIPADRPNRRTRRALARAQIRMAKIRCSKHPWKRRAQWVSKYRGQRQDWWAYCNVLYAAKISTDPPPLQTPGGMDVTFGMPLLWRLSYRKFGFRACGGRAEIARVVVFLSPVFGLASGRVFVFLYDELGRLQYININNFDIALFERFRQIEQTNLIYCANVHTKKIQTKTSKTRGCSVATEQPETCLKGNTKAPAHSLSATTHATTAPKWKEEKREKECTGRRRCIGPLVLAPRAQVAGKAEPEYTQSRLTKSRGGRRQRAHPISAVSRERSVLTNRTSQMALRWGERGKGTERQG
ncbi:hypothetical protein B0H17DRAFT_1174362 [Mycena rosella]|uniref:Uncharacterized protein n=1 Tax=Mycena rosella TaxID=1033263 RepID=A0AAD7MAH2_MYCRO|nr:hypothetical protein B0H17DRAFT_1174362 [Mycena rosella]